MDLVKLKSFCKVYEYRSFSKAASSLFLSQPTVSSHIISLEEELGVKLFDRVKRFVIPTLAGERLYSYAKELVFLLEKAEKEMSLFQNRVVGKLVVGGSTIPAHYILPKILKNFKEKYSEVELLLEVDDSYNILKKVFEGEIDIGMVGVKVDEFWDLEYEPIVEDRLVLIGKLDIKKVKINDLKTFKWVIREQGSGTRSFMEKYFLELGISIEDLNVAVEVKGTEAVIKCVCEGLGVSVISYLAAKNYINAGVIKEIEVDGLEMRRDFFLVKHKGRYLFPASRAFISILKSLRQKKLT